MDFELHCQHNLSSISTKKHSCKHACYKWSYLKAVNVNGLGADVGDDNVSPWLRLIMLSEGTITVAAISGSNAGKYVQLFIISMIFDKHVQLLSYSMTTTVTVSNLVPRTIMSAHSPHNGFYKRTYLHSCHMTHNYRSRHFHDSLSDITQVPLAQDVGVQVASVKPLLYHQRFPWYKSLMTLFLPYCQRITFWFCLRPPPSCQHKVKPHNAIPHQAPRLVILSLALVIPTTRPVYA